jgi:hypothetical protein
VVLGLGKVEGFCAEVYAVKIKRSAVLEIKESRLSGTQFLVERYVYDS